jgi:hypothetical protein
LCAIILFPIDRRHADKVGNDAVAQYQPHRDLLGTALVTLTRLLDTVAHDPGARGLSRLYARSTPNRIVNVLSMTFGDRVGLN